MARTATSIPRFALRSFNAALEFDGVDDYASVPNSASLQPLTGNWTVEFWIKRLGLGTGDYPQIIGSRPWATVKDKGWAISLGGTSLSGFIGAHFADGTLGFDVATAANTKVEFNVWENWMLVFDKTNSLLNFYKNGQLDKAYAGLEWPTGSINQSQNIYIGRDIDGGNNRRVNAQLADMRVYNVALTAAQAADRYYRNTLISTGLVAWWTLGEGSGSSLADSAGSNTGTIQVGTTWTAASLPSALRSNSSSRSTSAARSAA